MAVAVQPTTETKGPSAPAPLWLASLVGSLFVLGGLAVVFYAVPKLWDTTIGPALTASLGSFVNFFARLVAQIAAAVVLAVVGSRIAGANRPHGLKGGILWAIVTVFIVVVLGLILIPRLGLLGAALAALAGVVLLHTLVTVEVRLAHGVYPVGWSTLKPCAAGRAVPPRTRSNASDAQ